MKRLVFFSIEDDGRKRVQSISAPIDETKIDKLDENMGFIDAGYVDPEVREGQKVTLYYNADTELVEVEYSPITFDDLTPAEKLEYLQKENSTLREENELSQQAIMELYELLVGGDE